MGRTGSLPRTEGSPRASPRPTSPASPSTTLSTPQGAGLRGPAASANSSYVPCHQLLCASRLSTPARHIRSFYVAAVVKPSCLFFSSLHSLGAGLHRPDCLAASYGVGTSRLQQPSIRAGATTRHPILSASFDDTWK